MAYTQLKYTGTAPTADSNTYNLFNSVLAGLPARGMAMAGAKRLVLDIKCDHSGTLKWYKSDDRGVTWNQLGQEAITAPASTDSLVRDYLVEPYADFKLDWVNGGSAQATWALNLSFTDERALAG